MINQLSCNRNLGWSEYSVQIDRDSENRLKATVNVEPTVEGIAEWDAAVVTDWELRLKEVPSAIEKEKLNRHTKTAIFSIGPSTPPETRQTVKAELRPSENQNNNLISIPIQIVIPTAQSLLLIFELFAL